MDFIIKFVDEYKYLSLKYKYFAQNINILYKDLPKLLKELKQRLEPNHITIPIEEYAELICDPLDDFLGTNIETKRREKRKWKENFIKKHKEENQ